MEAQVSSWQVFGSPLSGFGQQMSTYNLCLPREATAVLEMLQGITFTADAGVCWRPWTGSVHFQCSALICSCGPVAHYIVATHNTLHILQFSSIWFLYFTFLNNCFSLHTHKCIIEDIHINFHIKVFANIPCSLGQESPRKSILAEETAIPGGT